MWWLPYGFIIVKIADLRLLKMVQHFTYVSDFRPCFEDNSLYFWCWDIKQLVYSLCLYLLFSLFRGFWSNLLLHVFHNLSIKYLYWYYLFFPNMQFFLFLFILYLTVCSNCISRVIDKETWRILVRQNRTKLSVSRKSRYFSIL